MENLPDINGLQPQTQPVQSSGIDFSNPPLVQSQNKNDTKGLDSNLQALNESIKDAESIINTPASNFTIPYKKKLLTSKKIYLIIALIIILAFAGYLYYPVILKTLSKVSFFEKLTQNRLNQFSMVEKQIKPDINELINANKDILKLLDDTQINSSKIISMLDSRKSNLKGLFSKYSYDELTPVVEEPILMGLAADPYYAPYIEKSTTKTGKITIYTRQDSEGISQSATHSSQDVQNSQRYAMYDESTSEYIFLESPIFRNTPKSLDLSIVYKVTGVLIDDTLLVKDIFPYALASSGENSFESVLGAISPERGTLKHNLIVVNNSSRKASIMPDTLKSLDSTENNAIGLLKSYISENSYTNLRLVPKVSYITALDSKEYCNKNVFTKAAYAIANSTLSKTDIDNSILEIIDLCEEDRPGGSAYFNTPVKISVGTNRFSVKIIVYTPNTKGDTASNFARISAHEIGHTLGLSHASIFMGDGCNNPVNSISSCDFTADGDYYDLMGMGGHINAFAKLKLGWITNSNIKNITSSEAVSISPIEEAGNKYIGVLVPVVNNPLNTYLGNKNKYYYLVQNHQKLGLNSNLNDKFYGVTVRLVERNGDLLSSLSGSILMGPYKPISSKSKTPVIDSQNIFYDALNKITIKPVAKDGKDISVQINIDKTIPKDIDAPVINIKLLNAFEDLLSADNITGKIKIQSNISDTNRVKIHKLIFANKTLNCDSKNECEYDIDTNDYYDNKSYVLKVEAGDEYDNVSEKEYTLSFSNFRNFNVSKEKFKTTYFESLNFLGSSKTILLDDLNVRYGNNPINLDNKSFGAVFEKVLNLTGVYKLDINSTDGVKVYIDKNLVLSDWKPQSYKTRSINYSFTGKDTDLRIEFFRSEGTKEAKIELKISKSDQALSYKEAQITSPLNNSTLTSTTTTFEWDKGQNVDEYYLRINKSNKEFGRNDLFNGSITTDTKASVINLPSDGSSVYARLYSKINGVWRYNDYVYKSVTIKSLSSNKPIEITSPTSGSNISSNYPEFIFTKGTNVDRFILQVSGRDDASDIITSKELYTDSKYKMEVFIPNNTTVYVTVKSYFKNNENYEIKYFYNIKLNTEIENSGPSNSQPIITQPVPISNTQPVESKTEPPTIPSNTQPSNQPTAPSGNSVINISALGESNEIFNPKSPKMEVRVNGKLYSTLTIKVKSYSKGFDIYTVNIADRKISESDEVSLIFINDSSDPSPQPAPNPQLTEADRNIYLNRVDIDGRVYDFRKVDRRIIYDRAAKENGENYKGFSSFGSSSDNIGLLKYNDALGFSYLRANSTYKSNFTEEIFWNGAVRIKDTGY